MKCPDDVSLKKNNPETLGSKGFQICADQMVGPKVSKTNLPDDLPW